jgi:AcrR family transcriptional regulator
MGADQDKGQSQTISELRRERERAGMTDRIMNTAREMFVRDGYEAVTLRRIAEAIEYSPAAIYQYFEDKRALVMAIIEADTSDLRAKLLECLKLEDPIEQLTEMARQYADWGITHPNHYRLLLMPPPAWLEHGQELWEQEYPPLEHEALVVLNTAVKTAMDRGLFKEKYTDPALVAATLWAGIHGAVLLEINTTPEEFALLGGQDASFERRFNMLKDVFLDGFLKPEARE